MNRLLFGFLAIAIGGCAVAEQNTSQSISTVSTSQPISGNWKITSLRSEPIEQNLRTANIKFENGRISGTAFCNNYSGEIIGQMPNISFGPVISTEMACMENLLMDKEAKFHAMLGEVKSAVQNGNQLKFKNQTGVVIAVFSKANI